MRIGKDNRKEEEMIEKSNEIIIPDIDLLSISLSHSTGKIK